MMRNGFLSAALLLNCLLLVQSAVAQEADLGADLACRDCPTSHWYTGVDLAVLKPHVGSVGAAFLDHPRVDITPEYDFEVAPRIWLGWENPECLGVRARYWTIDANATQTYAHSLPILDADILGTQTSLEAQAFDVEATQSLGLGRLQVQVAGGVRYAKMETGLSVFGEGDNAAPFNAGIGMDFEGFGPTVGIGCRRPIGSRGLSLVGAARASWVYGETDLGLLGELSEIPVSVDVEDHVMQINEVGLGVDWSRCLGHGGVVSVALLWEAQAWEWAPVAGLVHQDIGLTGPTVALSYMY